MRHMTELQDKGPYRQSASVFITDGQGSVLFCERLDEESTPQTVQGGIEKGETAKDAAMRELQEELGIGEGDFRVICECDQSYRYDWSEEFIQKKVFGTPYIGQELNFFLAEISREVTFNLGAHDREFARVRWGDPVDLVKQTWELKKDGYIMALRFFGLID